MISFGTKAEILEGLSSVVKTAKILPQIRFTVDQWKNSPEVVFEQLHRRGWLQDFPVIVRSSSLHEDGASHSCAGHFCSVANVVGRETITNAIFQVIQSFEGRSGLDQVFIQPMLLSIKMSGVAFSKDPNTGGPYYVINYDDKSNSTSSVTSGSTNDLKTFYCYRMWDGAVSIELEKVLVLVKELEAVFQRNSLDVEFALAQDDQLYLLQVRPLVCNSNEGVDDKIHCTALHEIYEKVSTEMKQHPYLHGSKTVYGVMTDWNPAEMIGVRPRPLALSLYKELITDTIWAYQRDNYGYINLRSFPLLLSFHGLPYVDVRVDFNSFIPAEVPSELAERLSNFYLEKLLQFPGLHDKVEFEILYTCYTLDISERLQKLLDCGFSRDDCELLLQSLRKLTNNIIHGESGLWRKDREKISELERRQDIIRSSNLNPVNKIYWLLEDCKRYGTLPFAGLARAGFIAVQLLRSLVHIGVFSVHDYDYFMGSLNAVGSRMIRDFRKLPKTDFLLKYGHLRPGTYDILSPTYAEDPERYFDWKGTAEQKQEQQPDFVLSLEQIRKIKELLIQHRLDHDVLGLFDFIRQAIEGREYAKFIFTRSVSEVFTLLKKLASTYGYTADDCSYLDINCLKDAIASCTNISSLLKTSIEKGKKDYALTKQIVLPPLITSAEDVWAFHLPESQPNFITLKRAQGHVVFTDHKKERFCGSILFIPSADPGYDWIFSHQPAGFITMFGGVNSHMAIRAGELGMPAVIGAGEALYTKWSSGQVIDIDCPNKQVNILR